MNGAVTRSPTVQPASPGTSRPISAISPANSWPGTCGSATLSSWPIQACQSLRQTPVARTRMTAPRATGLCNNIAMRFVTAVLLASVCFGTTGTAQALGPDASAASIGAARILIGGGALGVVALAISVAGRRRGATGTSAAPTPGAGSSGLGSHHRIPSWLIVIIGAGGVLGYQPAFFAGTAANGVAVGTVVALGSAPVITGALDWLLRRRYPGHRWLVATAIATSGVGLLAAATDPGQTAIDPLGLLASLGAATSYAVYTLAAKALLDRGWTPTGSMGALFGGAAIVSLPLL
ncbi:MAG: EamA family transporter, partial [Agromyces sp.]|nr:EamA family transporter [Agromyces sp.]